MKRLLIASLSLLLCQTYLYPQNAQQDAEWAAELIENIAEQSELELDYSFLIDNLIKLRHNPININSATREELEQIPFLSDMHIEALLFQRYQSKDFFSIYELQVVEGLDRRTLEYLEPLITFDIATREVKRSFRPRADLFARSQFQLQKRVLTGVHINRVDVLGPHQGVVQRVAACRRDDQHRVIRSQFKRLAVQARVLPAGVVD